MTNAANEPSVLVSEEGSTTRILLNRPRAINALNSEMFLLLREALDGTAGAQAPPGAIVLEGSGERGFCGGGDIKEISAASDPRDYFSLEYTLDYAVHASPVPIVSFMDGIVMGGGIGIGGHVAHRVVTERSRLAMPEVRIGIVPDVGGHLLLANASGSLGEYLAITAGELSGPDAVALGFADALVPSERLRELRDALAAGEEPGAALRRFAVDHGSAPLLAVREWFDPIADDALGPRDERNSEEPKEAAIRLLRALETSELAVARETAELVRGMNPVSVAITLAQIARTRADRLDLAGVLEDDYRVVSRLAAHPNFAEGVRAQLIDKDRDPRWIPARLEDLDPAELARLLAPHPPGENGLGLG